MNDSNPNTTNTGLQIEHLRPGLWIVVCPGRDDRHLNFFTIEIAYDHQASDTTYRITALSRSHVTNLRSLSDALAYCRTSAVGRPAPPP